MENLAPRRSCSGMQEINRSTSAQGIGPGRTSSRPNEAENLTESEKHFREMADSAPMMVWVTDPSGYCTFLSESWYRFTGQKVEEGLGLGWVNALHPDDRLKAKEAFTSANARRGGFRVEYRLRTSDGEFRWALDSATPRFGPDGS